MAANRFLMIGYVWPEPESSAAGVRDQAFLEIFRGAGFEVTFASGSKVNERTAALERDGWRTAPIAPNDPAFDDFVAQLDPAVVFFGRYILEEQFGWRVRRACPNALRILDTSDLHFLRIARGRALEQGARLEDIFDGRIELRGEELYRELASIHRSDLVWVCSDFERDLLTRELGVPERTLGIASFFYPPMAVATATAMGVSTCEPASASHAITPSFEERRHFVSVGNFRHAPNADSVRWLKSEIWPRIRAKLPITELHVYGAYPSREMTALSDPSTGFRVLGPATGDVVDTLRGYRVNLATLRFGAGIKGKIAEGWRAQTPVATTPIGSEGMTGGLPFGGLIARNAEQLAQEAIRLYQDEQLWAEKSLNGVRIINELFNREINASRLLQQIQVTRADLENRRRKNIVGELLWYHGHRSTEYFSRWIEAKNQKPGHSKQPNSNHRSSEENCLDRKP